MIFLTLVSISREEIYLKRLNRESQIQQNAVECIDTVERSSIVPIEIEYRVQNKLAFIDIGEKHQATGHG